jgi:predicted RNase H-like nuclease (RuvC/YqgF family)
MKFFTIALLLITPIFAFGQGERDNDLDKKIKSLEVRNKKLQSELNAVKQSNQNLQSAVAGMTEKIQSEITKSQELQAQNERAMNLALDEFSKKFEKQNETVKGVQDTLDQKFNNQLIFFFLGMILVVIIAIVATKNATKKALTQNQANWNNFQEHLLKK